MRIPIALLALSVSVASSATLLAPSKSLAIEMYRGNVIGECRFRADLNSFTNVTASIGATAPNWYVNTMKYTFTPTFIGNPLFGSAPGEIPSTNSKLASFSVPPGNYTVVATEVATGGQQGTYSLTAPSCRKATPTPTPTIIVKATPTPTPTIIVTTAPTPAPTFDPCCPPWNASLFKSSLFYQGTGNISQPYGLKFTPTTAMNSALSAYLNYLHALFGSTSLTMTFTSTPSVGGPPATWTWPSGVPGSSNTYTNMQVGTWYHLCFAINANGQVPRGFISDKCNGCIDVRIQVLGRQRMLQTKFPNGRVFQQAINASGRAQ